MTDPAIKQKILEIFQQERQMPSANFEESHFMDFLTYPPRKKNSLKNTFKGVRKYYRFMDRLELEFGICFSVADLDKYYSVEGLAKKMQQRIEKGKGNIMILKERTKRKDRYILEIILILILAGVYLRLGIHWIPLTLTVVFGLVIYWTLSSRIHDRKHLEKLTKRILTGTFTPSN